MSMNYLSDLIGLSKSIEELAVSREPFSIMYKDLEVIEISRIARSGTDEILAEKIDELARPPKFSRMIDETIGYILDLENGDRFQLDKKTKEIRPYEGNYPEC